MTIAIIIPCYRVKAQVEEVLRGIDPAMHVICVDDACPEQSGAFIESLALPNVTVLYNEKNLGVGGAVKAGYRYALTHTDAEVFVKLDGDGQMPSAEVAELAAPIFAGHADYTKGNRFYYLRNVRGMPMKRLIGNVGLSFLTKLSSGYWDVMDPTNGFTAISRSVLQEMDLDSLHNRYYFESDMLCKLYLHDAVIRQYPMRAKYAGENSSLKPFGVMGSFLRNNTYNAFRRIIYTYFVRDFNAGSLALLTHWILGAIGVIYGGINWLDAYTSGEPKAAGVVMFAGLCVILSMQFLLFFLNVDMHNNPNIKGRWRLAA